VVASKIHHFGAQVAPVGVRPTSPFFILMVSRLALGADNNFGACVNLELTAGAENHFTFIPGYLLQTLGGKKTFRSFRLELVFIVQPDHATNDG